MPRKPSPETEVRSLRRDLRVCREQLSKAEIARDSFRGQLTQALQEVAAWKRRFDALLARDQTPPSEEC